LGKKNKNFFDKIKGNPLWWRLGNCPQPLTPGVVVLVTPTAGFYFIIILIAMTKIKNLMLSKNSSTSEIKAYFEQVLSLSKTIGDFPVRLDDVWPLVYGRKQEAVRSLKENFIEEIDYQVLNKNAQNSKGGRPKSFYYLSVSCLEYFIARKIRPVFEVYRVVFHQAVNKQEFNEQEIANFLKENLSDTSKLKSYKTALSKQFGFEYELIAPEIVYSCFWNDERSLIDNMNNLVAIFRNNIAAATFQTYEAEKYRKHNLKLLGVIRSFVRDVDRFSDVMY